MSTAMSMTSEIELGLLQTQMAPKTAQREEVRVCELRVRQNAQRAESGRARDAPGKWAMGMDLRQRNIKLSLALVTLRGATSNQL